MAKHTEKLLKATFHTKKHSYPVIVDKYSNGDYKVVVGPDFAVGEKRRYGHGITERKKLKDHEAEIQAMIKLYNK